LRTLVINHALRQERLKLLAKVVNEAKQLGGSIHDGTPQNATGCPEFGVTIDGCHA